MASLRNKIKSLSRMLIQTVFGLFCTSAFAVTSGHPLEQAVCGFKEPLSFWLWNLTAGPADASRVADLPLIEEVSLQTQDGRHLRGYKHKTVHSQAKGYLLIAQGNAMLADQIISSFHSFAEAGYDVYAIDYRGYGRSEGKRRFKAMLSDYREIIRYLDSLDYPSRAFYGMSFGGILLLDALRDDSQAKTLVVDSSPSRLSGYGCPLEHDPVNNFPKEASHTMVIVGAKDTIVSPEDSKELVMIARNHGATIIEDKALGHPFIDGQTVRRFKLVHSFLERSYLMLIRREPSGD